ncbi:hypothetical protein [Phycicoccus sp. Soil748]|uniref:hypothetical protein n=1 Tax=Phycicoccus sp. Soil748 TaxID=1736397 RepID=UPI0012E38A41|nr:hypothetical protein [Phycicoccus sp. Soil748]
MFRDPLEEPIRHKLALAVERNQPRMTLSQWQYPNAAEEMAHIAIELVVGARGDLSLRAAKPHPQVRARPFDQLISFIIHEECPLALDAVGAWADGYARLPGLPWQRHEEEVFLNEVEEILSETKFAIRGREGILREDLGAVVLIDKPLAALVSNNPALRHVDDKLREALEELSAGNAADAVTDAGTALQMLLEHLGYAGGQLGDQVKQARKSGWLDGIDTPMADAVDAIVRWIASVRNQRSDAHHGPPPETRDAEFVVRIVGLLVLRFG